MAAVAGVDAKKTARFFCKAKNRAVTSHRHAAGRGFGGEAPRPPEAFSVPFEPQSSLVMVQIRQ